MHRFGKITGLVYYHPEWGAHLLVTPYKRLLPPAYFVPTGEPEERVYVQPNTTVFQYSIDEWVAIIPHTGGLNIAVKFDTGT